MIQCLPSNAHLAHLKKQAKDRLKELRRERPDAALHEAQFELAREYGFASWPKLSKAVGIKSGRSDEFTGALRELKSGKPIILFDDEGRENEGDFVVAAEHATAETVNFVMKYGRGTLCLALSPEQVDRLGLPLMQKERRSAMEAAFTVSIDAAAGVTTGVSAADRAATVRAAVADDAGPQSVRVPGHIFPLRAEAGGVKVRPGHTEGSVDMMKLAGLKPAALICEILNDDGTMARWPDLEVLAKTLGLRLVKMSELLA